MQRQQQQGLDLGAVLQEGEEKNGEKGAGILPAAAATLNWSATNVGAA